MQTTKRNLWKIAYLMSVPVLVLFIFLESYIIIDSAVTTTYLQDQAQRNIDDLKLLSDIFPKGMSKKDLIFTIRKIYPDSFIVDEDSEVRAGHGIIFKFDQNQTLQKIENL